MKTKIKRTNIKNVFNQGGSFGFDVNTPQFVKEAAENCEGGMYAICWNIFLRLLGQVAERAIELNDPVLNALMIRLNLYDVNNHERYEMIKKMKEIYEENTSV